MVLIETQFFPPVHSFCKGIQYGSWQLEACENYQKGAYRNRCFLAGANGILSLSVPLKKGKNERQAIRDVKIAYDTPWPRHHWQSIRSAYGSAPYFHHYAPELEKILKRRAKFLFDLNLSILSRLLEDLQLELPLTISQDYIGDLPAGICDLRDQIRPKNRLKHQDPDFEPVSYPQLFEEKNGFLSNLSILDLLFCTGPEALFYLEQSIRKKASS